MASFPKATTKHCGHNYEYIDITVKAKLIHFLWQEFDSQRMATKRMKTFFFTARNKLCSIQQVF